jgi:malonyl-CoA O-methyltransferase
MTKSTQYTELAISPEHVRRQFSRRGKLREAEFIYGEISRRMMDRLKLIRIKPAVIVDAGCGAGQRFGVLRERWPQAKLIAVDHSETLLKLARSQAYRSGMTRLLDRLSGKHLELLCADLADTSITAESVDLVWSNLVIHWHPRPHDVLAEWSRILRPGGLVFFSGWGPSTGIELRKAIDLSGLKTQTLPLVDMHDLGDIMMQAGFADPVMDQETITLTYQDPIKLLSDARILAGNPNPRRQAALVTRHWQARLLEALAHARAADGTLKLTIEVAYGHAWRNAARKRATETHISLEAIAGRKGSRQLK